MPDQPDDSRRPRLFQGRPEQPVFRGLRDMGGDIECQQCDGVALVRGVADNALFDLDIVCAACGSVLHLPVFPSGRGLGGVLRKVRRDHRFVGTFALEMDEVVVGPSAEQQRARETGAPSAAPNERSLGIAGLEAVMADARRTFDSVLESLRGRRGASKHPLIRLLGSLQHNVSRLREGDDVVDVRTAINLQRATAAFASWARDPSHARILQESTQSETFDHNTALLLVASTLETARLAPELVPPNDGRTADLILRISASRFVDVDVKAPRALRYPEEQVLTWADPRRTIKKALRRSRGQFARDGILVIAGEIWFGGIDAYAEVAEHLLNEKLAADATPEARAHYAQLLGITFVSTGYEDLGRSFQSRLFMRWVRNPRYVGEIDLELPRDLDGPFSIAFGQAQNGTNSASDAERPPEFDTRHDPAQFRVTSSNEVEVTGTVVNQAPGTTPGRTIVWQFPTGTRPGADVAFDVACEAGFTSVTVRRDGTFLADPSVGVD